MPTDFPEAREKNVEEILREGVPEVGTENIYTESIPTNYRVYKDDSGIVHIVSAEKGVEYTGDTFSRAYNNLYNDLSTEELVNIGVFPDRYTIDTNMTVRQQIMVDARNSIFDVDNSLLQLKCIDSMWASVTQMVSPEWYGGNFYMNNGKVLLEDFLGGKFMGFKILPETDSMSLLQITTDKHFSAIYDIKGMIDTQNDRTGTFHDDIWLVDLPPGTGTGNVGARASIELILKAGATGHTNKLFYLHDGGKIYDTRKFEITAFLNDTNKGIVQSGRIDNSLLTLRGDMTNNPVLYDITSSAGGGPVYLDIDGVIGDYQVNNAPPIAIAGPDAFDRIFGSVNIGTGGTYGPDEYPGAMKGSVPIMGFNVSYIDTANNENITIEYEIVYIDGDTRSITKSYTSDTTGYDYITEADIFNLSEWKSIPVNYVLRAKSNLSTTSATVDYRAYAKTGLI